MHRIISWVYLSVFIFFFNLSYSILNFLYVLYVVCVKHEGFYNDPVLHTDKHISSIP